MTVISHPSSVPAALGIYYVVLWVVLQNAMSGSGQIERGYSDP